MYDDSDDDEASACQEMLWSDIKSFITSEFMKVEQSMTDTSQRIQSLEDNVGSLSRKVNEMVSDGSVSSSSIGSTPSSSGRKRKSPLGLQVNIIFCYQCTIHDSFLSSCRAKSELFTNLWMMTVS